MLPWYCTREDVKAALDVAETARADAQIDRLIAGASRSIEGSTVTRRRFYPERRSQSFTWPDDQLGRAWRLWLNQHELVSLESVSSGGTAVAGTVFVEPDGAGPPFNRIEIDLGGPGAFSAGDTYQRAVTVTGVFGYRDDSVTAGTLAGNVDSISTTIDVTDSAAIGVGALLLLGAERLQVVGKSMLTTGQTLLIPLTAMTNSTLVAVTDGTLFAVGEVVLLDSERMLIVDIASDSLIVRRAWDGSTLAVHSGSTIYAPRRLRVARATLGTLAAGHSSGTVIERWTPPELVQQLAVAETLVALGREQSGYARTVGAGDGVRAAPGGDIRDLRAQVRARYGRTVRAGVV